MSHGDKQNSQSLARRCRAFTLIEIIIAVLILGILAGIAIPLYSKVIDSARQTTAISNAKAVNAAQVGYALIVPSAQANWSSAASDTDRLALLIGANLLPGAPGDYLTSTGGYSLQLAGSVRGNAALMYKGSSVSY